MSKKNNHKCSGYWLIDAYNVGECLKMQPNDDLSTCVCGDTGLPCPYDGVKDFGKLKRRHEGLRDWMKAKASIGGKQGKHHRTSGGERWHHQH